MSETLPHECVDTKGEMYTSPQESNVEKAKADSERFNINNLSQKSRQESSEAVNRSS